MNEAIRQSSRIAISVCFLLGPDVTGVHGIQQGNTGIAPRQQEGETKVGGEVCRVRVCLPEFVLERGTPLLEK